VTESEGFVLKRMDYKESSKIVFLYTAAGKTSFLVHGANKLQSPFLAKTEVLNKLRVTTEGRGLKIAKDIDTLEIFPAIKQDLVKYTYCLHVLETVYFLAESDIDHAKLYGFLDKIFPKIATETDYVPYIYMFETKLLYLLGLQPELKQCIVCRKENLSGFSVSEGGVVCGDHLPSEKPYSLKTVLAFSRLYHYDLEKPSALLFDLETVKDLRLLLDDYYHYHLNLETKSRSILRGLLGY